MPEDFSSLDVTWFAYGLAVAGRYNSMVVDGLIEEVLEWMPTIVIVEQEEIKKENKVSQNKIQDK